jgi:hypothetical protein
MRFPILRPYVRLEMLKKILTAVTVAWAVTVSIALVRVRPTVILIGLDENGTRIIQSESDPLLARERVKFVREFLYRFYHYSTESFAKAASHAGDLMSDTVWKEREGELKRIAEQMKTSPRLEQEAKLLDLRELGEDEYEADLAVRVKTRLVDKESRYRATLRIGPRKRNADNPYPYEVTSLHETEIH